MTEEAAASTEPRDNLNRGFQHATPRREYTHSLSDCCQWRNLSIIVEECGWVRFLTFALGGPNMTVLTCTWTQSRESSWQYPRGALPVPERAPGGATIASLRCRFSSARGAASRWCRIAFVRTAAITRDATPSPWKKTSKGS